MSPKNKQISSNWNMQKLRYSMMFAFNGTVTCANLKCLCQYKWRHVPDLYSIEWGNLIANGIDEMSKNRWLRMIAPAVWNGIPYYWSIKQSLGAVHFRCLTKRHKRSDCRFFFLLLFSCWMFNIWCNSKVKQILESLTITTAFNEK